MVEQRQLQLSGQVSQPRGDSDVILARRRIAARVIMHEDEAGGVQRMRATQNLSKIHTAARNVAACQRIDGKQIELLVDEEREEPLGRLLPETFHIGFHRASLTNMPWPV